MPTKELSEKISRISNLLDQEARALPRGVSRYFVRMAILGMNHGASLSELRQSFLENQSEVADRVNASFDWLEKKLT